MIFKPCVGYEGFYEVSECGTVRSVDRVDCRNHFRRSRIMKHHMNDDGYPRVVLSRDGSFKHVTVHKLVAETFIGPRPDGMQINHKDLNRGNPNVRNLEYLTPTENVEYSKVRGANYASRGNAKINFDIADEIRKDRKDTGLSYKKLGERYGLCDSMIGWIIQNKAWIR